MPPGAHLTTTTHQKRGCTGSRRGKIRNNAPLLVALIRKVKAPGRCSSMVTSAEWSITVAPCSWSSGMMSGSRLRLACAITELHPHRTAAGAIARVWLDVKTDALPLA